MDKAPSDQQVTQQVQSWVESLIVAYNICPFAKREVDRGTVRYAVIRGGDLDACLESLVLECKRLDQDAGIETTLLVYPEGFGPFDKYLDFADLANALLVQMGYEGVYQLATFHPEYCFADSEPDDPANYTNRGPYPMLHLLREASLEKALQFVEAPEQIPERNIRLTREMGLAKMKSILATCKKD